jgi:hypothetical protein
MDVRENIDLVRRIGASMTFGGEISTSTGFSHEVVCSMRGAILDVVLNFEGLKWTARHSRRKVDFVGTQ